MEEVKVRTLFPNEEFVASGADELRSILSMLASRYRGDPLLVVLTNRKGDNVKVGVGADYTTIELFPAARDKHIRSFGKDIPVESIIFTYDGEWTDVRNKYLVPDVLGRAAVVKWFESGILDEEIQWNIVEWPPPKNGIRRQ